MFSEDVLLKDNPHLPSRNPEASLLVGREGTLDSFESRLRIC